MAFGKRTAGQAPPPVQPSPEFESEAAAPSVRTRVANSGGMDGKFIGLAIGVVVVSAGGAIAAPSLMSMMGGAPVRPIEQVIAGLDRKEMRTALAHEAFPDDSGRAFMTKLATNFPQQHGRLLDALADAAAAGGDRNDLFLATNAWTMSFGPQQLNAIGRTGAEGFDAALDIASDFLKVVEADAGSCTLKSLQSYIADPTNLTDLTRYGGEGYRASMRANAVLVDLAAKGGKAPPADTNFTLNDENALRSAFISMIADPQIMSLMQSGMNAGPQGPNPDLALNMNVCQLARTVIIKLDTLPADTKGRLFAVALSGDFGRLNGNLGSPFGADAMQGMQMQGMPSSFGGSEFFP